MDGERLRWQTPFITRDGAASTNARFEVIERHDGRGAWVEGSTSRSAVSIILSGFNEGEVSLDGDMPRSGSGEAGRISIFPSDVSVRGISRSVRPYKYVVAEFDPAYFSDIAPSRPYIPALEPHVTGYIEIIDLALLAMARTVAELLAAKSLKGLALDGLALSAAAYLIERYGSRTPKRHKGGLTARQIRIVKDYVQSRLSEPISLGTLAGVVGLSSFHFCRAFKTSLGISPHRYQTVLRLERAKVLIASGLESVGDVAAAVGYDDPSYFARVFRQQVGVAPGQWRAQS